MVEEYLLFTNGAMVFKSGILQEILSDASPRQLNENFPSFQQRQLNAAKALSIRERNSP